MKQFSQIMLLSSILLLGITACEQIDIQNTTVQEVKQLIENGHDYTIIDVRTPEEFNEGTVPGAINIDVKSDDFLSLAEKLDKEDKYILTCRSGKRSSKAYELMTKAGFQNLLNMEGGYLAFTEE